MLLPAIGDINDLARVLGLPKFVLTRYVFLADRHYKRFRIRKRSGHGYRSICAPSRQLKGIQRWITAFILSKVDLQQEATAFRKGCSILRNARPHAGKDFVLNLDIADFFDQITTRRVVGLFKSLGFAPPVAFALARLTTYGGRVPQGAPSSPDIANIVCRRLDSRLRGLCQCRDWAYTRYCDDITISGAGSVTSALAKISAIVRDEGFSLNPRKTHLMRRGTRQSVTGLAVNVQPNIPRHRRKNWRAVFHQADLEPERFLHRQAQLQGYLAFLQMISPEDTAIDHYTDVLRKIRNVRG